MQMASGSDYAHAVVTARVGGIETGGQGTIPEETAGGMRVLWHHDQVRYVPACGTLPLGVGSVVEVPGFVVHRLEGCATGFDGPVRGSHKVPEHVTHQVRNAHTSLDSDTAGVHGLADVASLRDIE